MNNLILNLEITLSTQNM